MTIPINSQGVCSGFNTNTQITFVVGNKEMQIELRYLLSCDYFNEQVNAGMQYTRVIVQETTATTFQIFQSYLTTNQLPPLDLETKLNLYRLVHKYQHKALLDILRSELIKEIPSHCENVLSLAYFCKDEKLKDVCKKAAHHNPSHFVSLLFKLIEANQVEVLREVFKWSKNTITYMFTYSHKASLSPLAALIRKNEFGMAVELIDAANKVDISTSELISDPQYLIFQLLDRALTPTDEQNKLILSLARGNNLLLTSTKNSRNDPPIHIALSKGWNETFAQMLKECKTDVTQVKNKDGKGLLSEAIRLNRIDAVKALKDHPHLQILDSHKLQRYVQESIATKYPQMVKEVVSFPCIGEQVSSQIVENVILAGNLEVLKIIWPYLTSQDQIAHLRKKVFDSDRLDVAEIVFNNTFNASKDLYPSTDSSWFQHVAMNGKPKWLEFMAARCSNKSQVDSNGNTPLHLALHAHKYSEAYWLLKFNPEAAWAENNENKTPFYMLGGKEFEEALNRVIDEAEANPDENTNEMLLFWCAQNYLYPFCNRLLQLVKEPHKIKDSEGKTLLHLACEARAPFAVQKLLSMNFDVNEKDGTQSTPLHSAVMLQDVHLVRILLENGANAKICNSKGETPLSIALSSPAAGRTPEMQTIVELLEPASCAVQ